MRCSALWFGLVAIMLAVTPAQAQKKVDWSQYIDKRAAANTNAPASTPPVSSEPAAAPAPAKKANEKVAKAKASKTKAKAKAKAKARTKQKTKTRRK